MINDKKRRLIDSNLILIDCNDPNINRLDRHNLYRLANLSMKIGLHKSKTYICYISWMRLAKGIGDYPDVAYENFVDNLYMIVWDSCDQDITYWLKCYNERDQKCL